MNIKRVFLFVLDSFGIGALPDAEAFGDEGANTLKSVSQVEGFLLPTMAKLGLFAIEGNAAYGQTRALIGSYGRLKELSRGKDTVSGHWEMMGLPSDKPMPTYPHGFPKDILDKIEAVTGIGTLCNRPYSGTDVIRDYGEEQRRTGKMIVYTSADSVYQAAAHTDVIPLDALYAYCEEARKLLTKEHAVGRVIARPFEGSYPNYVRTSGRHDYALPPPSETVLDRLKSVGCDVIGVGKIGDIFAQRGITESIPTASNDDGMEKAAALLERDFRGLAFVNLVDFDSRYGHRNDVRGYAEALMRFDRYLSDFIPRMKEDDLLLVTADHGCDPGTEGTDHTREYVPLLAYRKGLLPTSLGTGDTFADIGQTLCSLFALSPIEVGRSFAEALALDVDELLEKAGEARDLSYAPYSSYRVGAALLTGDGKVYNGCNVESAAFSPTSCAERTALVKAMSEGERQFMAIAVVGGREKIEPGCTPCGVCRQFLYETAGGALSVAFLDENRTPTVLPLNALLPYGFSLNSFTN